ncbi:hypothetical protein [Streptomyces sp. NPDC059076]|uniref:DUF6197 family protein n=1 Tax=unclassified Streptomyces TaxID=2593676 RepID=UPI0036974A8A
MPSTLTPDQLDTQAAALYDTAAWQTIVNNWHTTSPEPSPTAPAAGPAPTPIDWRALLTLPVDELITAALTELPVPPPNERPLPGRIGAILPDRLHTWRRIGQPDIRPSTHLAYTRHILTTWGWQNTPYRLRNTCGARCICGAMLTAHRMGMGSQQTMNRAGAWLLTELRHQGWTNLIGPWNRAPGRTAEHALALLDATIRRASHQGQ